MATIRLWARFPSPATAFPRVTWFKIPGGDVMPMAIDWAAFVGLVVAVVAAAIAPRRRWCWWGIAAMLTILILMDQQRLQPWAYQSLLYAIVIGGLPWREGRRWITAIAFSIYFYSALGKLDYQFVHTVGREMIQALSQPIGGISDALATKFAFVLPVGELSVAALVAFPLTRRVGGICAIAMHVTLLALLGPLSLGHSYGVLAWNTLLAVEGWLLFVKRPRPIEIPDNVPPKPTPLPVRWGIRLIMLLALLAPLSERFGWWDHWTSWALYSPHNSRVEIQIHDSAIDRIPIPLRAYLADGDAGQRWKDLDVESWSLETRLAPIYPQARYQLSFASDLANTYELGAAIRVKVKSVSDRWTGGRKEVFLIGQGELDRELDRYWLVAKP